jgi:hypothetical protein
MKTTFDLKINHSSSIWIKRIDPFTLHTMKLNLMIIKNNSTHYYLCNNFINSNSLQAQNLSYLFPNDLMHPFFIDFFVLGGGGL